MPSAALSAYVAPAGPSPRTTVLVVGLAGAAAVLKAVSLLNDWPEWTRAPLAAAVMFGAAALVLRGKVVRAAGLLPLDAHRPSNTVAVGVAAAVLAVAATQAAGLLRIAAIAGTAVLLAWLLLKGRGSRAAWTVTPLVLVGVLTASVLAAQARADGISGAELLELVFVTALCEELAYRGGLLALAYRSLRPLVAEYATALAFGLWHVGNALDKTAGKSGLVRSGQVILEVALTFAGGCVFSWLRHRTQTLAAPVLAHAATNLPGLALRRVS